MILLTFVLRYSGKSFGRNISMEFLELIWIIHIIVREYVFEMLTIYLSGEQLKCLIITASCCLEENISQTECFDWVVELSRIWQIYLCKRFHKSYQNFSCQNFLVWMEKDTVIVSMKLYITSCFKFSLPVFLFQIVELLVKLGDCLQLFLFFLPHFFHVLLQLG